MDHFDYQRYSSDSDPTSVEACAGTQVHLSLLGIISGGFSLPSLRCEAQREVMVTCAHADMQLRTAQAMGARGQRSEATAMLDNQALPAAENCEASVERLALLLEQESRRQPDNFKSAAHTEKPDYCKVFPQQGQCT